MFIDNILDTQELPNDLSEKLIEEKSHHSSNKEKKKIIKYQITVIHSECEKFLFSEFKIILLSGCLLCFLLLLLKGFDSKIPLILNIEYGVIISLVCGYVSCIYGAEECLIVFEKSE